MSITLITQLRKEKSKVIFDSSPFLTFYIYSIANSWQSKSLKYVFRFLPSLEQMTNYIDPDLLSLN